MQSKLLTHALLLLSALVIFSSSAISAVRYQSAPHLEVALVTNIQEGETSYVGVHFKLEQGWHLYWVNPGDTGLAPTVKWQAPADTQIGSLAWPFPEAIAVEHLTNIGYENELLLTAPIEFDTVSAPSTLGAEVSWLVCKEICIPGNASLTLEKAFAGPQQIALFEHNQRLLPQSISIMDARIDTSGEVLELEVFFPRPLFREANQVSLFVENLDLVEYGEPQMFKWKNNRLVWRQQLSEFFQRLPDTMEVTLVLDDTVSYSLSIPTQ